MGFKEVRALVIEALQSDRYTNDERADGEEKNLLASEAVTKVRRPAAPSLRWMAVQHEQTPLSRCGLPHFYPDVRRRAVVHKGLLEGRARRVRQRAPVTRYLAREGDRGIGGCPQCLAEVETRLQVRTYRLQQSSADVPGALLDVCTVCGSTVGIPAQTTPRLREARVPLKEEQLEARIPTHLEDVLYLLAREFAAPVQAFRPAVLRYYLAELMRDPTLAQRVRMLAESELANAPARARVSLRVPAELLADARAAARAAGIARDSDLIRGLLLAAKEDVLDRRHPERIQRLSGAAQAGGAYRRPSPYLSPPL
jgi:hypothetical protein